MASAATEAEKGSPVVVGLLVVGNIIILVRPPPVLGAQWVGGEEGTAQAWGWGRGPRTPIVMNTNHSISLIVNFLKYDTVHGSGARQPGFKPQRCLFLLWDLGPAT